MRFGILGPLQVHHGGVAVVVGPPKQRALLAVLLVHANQVVSVDRLVELLWNGDPPAGAVRALHVHVSGLRKALGSGGRDGDQLLLRRPPGYLLRVAPGALDMEEFERLVAQARQARGGGALGQAARLLARALGHWRGPALADVEVAMLQQVVVPRLEEARRAATEERIDIELALGGHAGLVGELRALVAEQPFRERLCGALMLALYRSGRQAEALAVYRDARGRLVGELGVEPGAELQRLQRQILTADPTLQVRSQASAGEPAGTGSQPWPVPRQLPADIAAFAGRARELAQLEQTLTAQGTLGPVVVSAIDGLGGVGKSALAIHYAHQIGERFPDGQLYVDLQGATPGLAPLAPAEALGRLLRSLGLQPSTVPADVHEASGLLRSLLAARRLLLVLDNARDAAQVRWLLPASPTCAVLVTSRRALATLEGARHLHLDVLPAAEAVGLLGRLVGAARVTAEPEAAERLAELCGLLPLALRIAAARLAARPAWPLAALAQRLADARCRLDELDAGELAVRACFQVSHRLLAASPDSTDRQAAHAFGLLGLLDAPDLGVAVAARLLNEPEDLAERALERLVDAQLLDSQRPGRYRFHDLLRLFARERAQAGEDEPARQAALERALGWYLAGAQRANQFLLPAGLRDRSVVSPDGLVLADRQAALAWLEAERANLVAAARQAASHPTASIAMIACQLSEALRLFFDLRSHWVDWQVACEAAIQAAERAGDLPAKARALDQLGIVHGQQHRYRDAVDALEHSLAISRRVGDRPTQARALNNLGGVYLEQDRCREAISYYRQSLVLRREAGDRHGEGKVLNNLGEAYRKQHRYQEALGYYEQDLAICRRLGDARGEATTLHSLGEALRAQGRYQEALGCYQRALATCRQVGDRLEEGLALWGLGRALAAVDGPDAARAHWTAALGIFEDLGAPQADEIRGLLADHADATLRRL